jgi:hypothetical protein
MWGALSKERTGLSFTTAAGPRQHSQSRVRVPWDSWAYFIVSYSRLPFPSPPTTRRATVEVFEPASTREALRECPAVTRVWVMLRPTVSLGIKHPSEAYDQIFITVRQLLVCWCRALFLTRGQVCCLQLLLVLASTVILGSESRGTRDHILLSQIRDFSFRRLLRFARLEWRYSVPPPHGIALTRVNPSPFITSGQPYRKHRLHSLPVVICISIATVIHVFIRK